MIERSKRTPMRTDVIAELTLPEWCSTLELTERQRLSSRLRTAWYRPGVKIIDPHRGSDSLVILLAGSVEIIGTSGDRKVSFGYRSAGEVLHVPIAMTSSLTKLEISAVSSCQVAWLEPELVDLTLTQCPGFALALCKTMAGAISSCRQQAINFAIEDVATRLRHVLRTLASTGEVRGNPTLIIKKMPTHAKLALMIGTSREVVTRQLRALQSQNEIIVDGKVAFIPVTMS